LLSPGLFKERIQE